MTNEDKQFEQQVKASLDANVETLDADTRERLANMRRQALNAKTPSFKWSAFNALLPASALALCSLFAVFLVFNPQNNEVLPVQNDQVAVFELLDNSDELEAITDADFYVWMDENLNQDLNQDLEQDADTAS